MLEAKDPKIQIYWLILEEQYGRCGIQNTTVFKDANICLSEYKIIICLMLNFFF